MRGTPKRQLSLLRQVIPPSELQRPSIAVNGGGLHASGALNFSHLPDVFALAINEQISNAAHVAVVEQGSPHLDAPKLSLKKSRYANSSDYKNDVMIRNQLK
ncbi:hypothetical protein Celaphus_00005617 [Cervus elaphus hippelaphus]|uniref:Uncharacterized protein n=1 Tax=Cervus elaphus hippelaphus TaxID=46360 RepID=A0A212CWF8_CEREH|nr:hypothetical protein Celaphus_00005617 [Cervus elaphus hippelaphus]